MADQAKGGLGNYPTARCLPGGMPRIMAAAAQEYIVTPETTYILIGNAEIRRIFTDGRDWPGGRSQPTYAGYSIGKWIDRMATAVTTCWRSRPAAVQGTARL